MSTEQSESAPQVETKAAPAAVTAPQVETRQRLPPISHSKRRLLLQPRSARKAPSVWPPENFLPKKDGWPEKNKRKRSPRLIMQKSKRKPPRRPRIQKKKAQIAAASAPTNGSLLAVLEFPFSGSITSVKSSWQWPSPCSTNSKRRSPRRSSLLSPRVSSQNLLAIHGQEDLKKWFKCLRVIHISP